MESRSLGWTMRLGRLVRTAGQGAGHGYGRWGTRCGRRQAAWGQDRAVFHIRRHQLGCILYCEQIGLLLLAFGRGGTTYCTGFQFNDNVVVFLDRRRGKGPTAFIGAGVLFHLLKAAAIAISTAHASAAITVGAEVIGSAG